MAQQHYTQDVNNLFMMGTVEKVEDKSNDRYGLVLLTLRIDGNPDKQTWEIKGESFTATCWNAQAVEAQNAKTGDRVAISGKLALKVFDRQDGTQSKTVNILANRVMIVPQDIAKQATEVFSESSPQHDF